MCSQKFLLEQEDMVAHFRYNVPYYWCIIIPFYNSVMMGFGKLVLRPQKEAKVTNVNLKLEVFATVILFQSST